MSEELEDILGGDDPFEDNTSSRPTKKSDPTLDPFQKEETVYVLSKADRENIESQLGKAISLSLPKVVGGPVPSEYKEIVDRWLRLYEKLPKIDFDKIYDELGLLAVDSISTPTLQHLNEQLQKVQGAKDRLSEIMTDVLLVHTIKKRAVDVLKDSWGRFTSERNAESRKGDSVVRVSDFESDFAESEALLKACNHVLKNLDSLHENLSRRVSIIQLELKIHDIGRGALPDFNFSKAASSNYEELLNDETKEIDPTESIGPEEAF